MAKFLTSADSTLAIGVTNLFPVPVAIEGYATNDMYSFTSVTNVELAQGVDGLTSAGWVPNLKPMTLMLQATSNSLDMLQEWAATQETDRAVYSAFGTLDIPGVGKSAVLTNGYLTASPTFYSAARTLGQWSFTITWGKVTLVPLAF